VIYTVTPNPALDITWGVPGWERGSTTRVTDIMESPGGKGLNVARVADQLGADVCALGPLGGATGERVRELFASLAPRVKTRWIASPVPTRRSVALVDEQVSIFNEAGQAPPREVWSRCAESLASVLAPGDVCAICGSLPGDSRASDITPIFEAAKASGARIILDTSGTALVDAASYADVLKPNEHELRAATGCSTIDEGARMLLGRGAAWVFVSRGADGMDLYTHGRSWHASSDPTITGNPTGAGDAAVAAIATHLEWRVVLTEKDGLMALADAVATSTAAVVRPTAGEIDMSVRASVLQSTAPVRLSPLPTH
jgi:1-phosphofructokinase